MTIVSLALIAGGFLFLRGRLVGGAGAEREALMAKIPPLVAEISAITEKSKSAGSPGQLATVAGAIEGIKAELDGEKNRLKEIETKLDTAQKSVEEKEGTHQELKTAKEEDEMRLQELMERFGSISSESMALEQRLAQSMKNLDQLLGEIQLTTAQRSMFDDLSNSLSSAGERMRALLTEYQGVHDRLELLKQQHKDLEQEYTRLVEQQLGEG